jgi:hypothetical protein
MVQSHMGNQKPLALSATICRRSCELGHTLGPYRHLSDFRQMHEVRTFLALDDGRRRVQLTFGVTPGL